MSDTAYLKKRHNKWYVQVAVPPALRGKAFNGAKVPPVFIRTLGTDSLAVANRIKHIHIAEFKQRIEDIRAALGDPHIEPSIRAPSPITWRHGEHCDEAVIGGVRVAWMMQLPHDCDRGRYAVHAALPGVNEADGFPRYYMRKETAVQETEAWLRWRLWKQQP